MRNLTSFIKMSKFHCQILTGISNVFTAKKGLSKRMLLCILITEAVRIKDSKNGNRTKWTKSKDSDQLKPKQTNNNLEPDRLMFKSLPVQNKNKKLRNRWLNIILKDKNPCRHSA